MEQAWLVSAEGHEEGERTLHVPDTSGSWQVPGVGKPRTEDLRHVFTEGAKNLKKGRSVQGKPETSDRRQRATRQSERQERRADT